jgi:sigma-B regulation protein RsbU (phosphoserine phosphatase)
MILGAFQDSNYTETTIQLFPGDVILLYTDGVTEAQRNDEYFGMERLIEVVSKLTSKSPEEIIQGVLNAVDEFKDVTSINDDTTLVCISYIKGNTI